MTALSPIRALRWATDVRGRMVKLNRDIIMARDYRGFLKAVIAARAGQSGRVNYSALSRRAGFSSRGYLKEVLDGKKRVVPGSLPKFVKLFRLNRNLTTLFTILVALEEK